MPAYVPNYDFDVFVSYAHVDDIPMGVDRGWVSTFIDYLQPLVARRLGRLETFNIWFDRGELNGNDPITPEIHARLEKSATILIFLSPGYLASTWCQQELERFVSRAGENSPMIFVIELNKLDRPKSLNDLRGYQFWYLDEDGHERILAYPFPDLKDPNSPYYRLIFDVAVQLAEKLKELKNIKAEEVSPEVSQPPLATVFLAEVPPSLKEQRDEVRRYLGQQRVRIFPEKALALIEDLQKALLVADLDKAQSLIEDLQNKLDQDLKTCTMFIQLLDVDVFVRLPRRQYDRAKALNIKVVQWRDPSLQVSTVADVDHHKLLDGPEVQATKLTDFNAYLLRQLQPPAPSLASSPPSDGFVFVNAAPEDMTLAHKLQEISRTYGIDLFLPLEISETTRTEDVSKDLEENLLGCDAVVLLYGDSPAIWVRSQLRQLNKMRGKREKPLRVMAVYNEPKNSPKDPLNFSLQDLQIIDRPFAEFKDMLPTLLKGGV